MSCQDLKAFCLAHPQDKQNKKETKLTNKKEGNTELKGNIRFYLYCSAAIQDHAALVTLAMYLFNVSKILMG